ncbi:peptidylprolyl isomerase [Patescibacteria group bacterium]
MKKRIFLFILFLLLLLGAGFFVFSEPTDQAGQETETNLEASETKDLESEEKTALDLPLKEKGELPAMEIKKDKKYFAVLTTDQGEIKIEFFAIKTPITVNNFVTLAQKNFYDKTVFHRVIKGFMIQGGDPKGDGTGGPGYQFDDEPFEGKYTRGTVAMANAGPNTNGSQFFIMHQDYELPKNYVIFGQVVEGLSVVDEIAQAPTKAGLSGENSTPVDPVKIESVEIVEE